MAILSRIRILDGDYFDSLLKLYFKLHLITQGISASGIFIPVFPATAHPLSQLSYACIHQVGDVRTDSLLYHSSQHSTSTSSFSD